MAISTTAILRLTTTISSITTEPSPITQSATTLELPTTSVTSTVPSTTTQSSTTSINTINPSTTTQSTTVTVPSITTQSTTSSQPLTMTQSTTTTEPLTMTQSTTMKHPSTTSITTTKPSTMTQSTTTADTSTITQSTTTSESTTTTQSTSTIKPPTTSINTTEPSTTTQSTTTTEPSAMTQSTTKTNSSTMSQSATMIEPEISSITSTEPSNTTSSIISTESSAMSQSITNTGSSTATHSFTTPQPLTATQYITTTVLSSTTTSLITTVPSTMSQSISMAEPSSATQYITTSEPSTRPFITTEPSTSPQSFTTARQSTSSQSITPSEPPTTFITTTKSSSSSLSVTTTMPATMSQSITTTGPSPLSQSITTEESSSTSERETKPITSQSSTQLTSTLISTKSSSSTSENITPSMGTSTTISLDISTTTPTGTSTTPLDTSTTPLDTSTTIPIGTSTTTHLDTSTTTIGSSTTPNGTSTTPSGTSTTPNGTSTTPSGTSTTPIRTNTTTSLDTSTTPIGTSTTAPTRMTETTTPAMTSTVESTTISTATEPTSTSMRSPTTAMLNTSEKSLTITELTTTSMSLALSESTPTAATTQSTTTLTTETIKSTTAMTVTSTSITTPSNRMLTSTTESPTSTSPTASESITTHKPTETTTTVVPTTTTTGVLRTSTASTIPPLVSTTISGSSIQSAGTDLPTMTTTAGLSTFSTSNPSETAELVNLQRLYLITPLNKDFASNLTNTLSSDFVTFRSLCQMAFTSVFRNVDYYNNLTVTNFKNVTGRTAVAYYIQFNVTAIALVQNVAQTVLKLEANGSITIGNQSYKLSGYTGIFRSLNNSLYSNDDDVNWCLNSSLFTCDTLRVCNDSGLRYTCLCKEGFVDVIGECIDAKEVQYELYPYGTSAKDSKLPKGDDDTLRVDIETGFPVDQSLQYIAYIGINGLITFGQRDSGLNFELNKNKMMLSPYMADISTIGNPGEIWYQVYLQSTSNSSVFSKVSSEVQQFMEIHSYTAKLVIVVTWDRVALLSSFHPQTEQATFQTVLATDGTTSYALVYYKTNAMKWVYQKGTELVIGISYGNGNKPKSSVYSNTKEAFTNLDRIKGNTGRFGVWIYKMGEKYSADQECDDWYERNRPEKSTFEKMNRDLPQCPCSSYGLGSAWIDPRDQNGITCYRMSEGKRASFSPYGRDCCYKKTGKTIALVTDMPDAGGITAYKPKSPKALEDQKAHDTCCYQTTSTDYCRKYYSLRPIGTCTTSFQFVSAASIGDPHVITLDGKEYTFNGWGEYTMVKIDSVNLTFTLQGRTGRVVTDNGTETNATVFTAFAARENVTSVFVQLDPIDNKSMIVFASNQDYSKDFRQDSNFLLETTLYTLRRVNSSLTVAFASEIELTVIPGIRLLEITVNMPLKFKNQTLGLMGNFNANPEDDFMLPNGTILPGNMSEKKIFEEFGTKWSVNFNDSAFHYEERQGPANFTHPEFKPIFLEEKSASELQEAENVCGGKNNTACIYDYLATGNQALANATRQSQNSAGETQAKIKNSVPELNVTGTLTVKANETAIFSLRGSDADSNDILVYHVAENVVGNVTLNQSTGEVIYLPNPAKPSNLSFYVVDSQNAASPIRVVVVVYCSGCSGHGSCDYTRSIPALESKSFEYAACNCTTGWTGDDCSKDFNGCLENPCIVGQNCTDLTPDQQSQSQRAYNCSACPAGYDVNNNTSKCEDVNECISGAHHCAQFCNNTAGSYFCSCGNGYRLNSNGRYCDDVNECADHTSDCQQHCINTEGGYNCSCEVGYTLEANGSCIQQESVRASCASVGCGQGCKVNNNTAQCFCLTGYIPDTSNGSLCVDVNECGQSLCSQDCSNTVGSFICSCYSGYQLDTDRTTCVQCPSLRYGPGCQYTCECSGRGTGCDRVSGCVCQEGWRGTNCQIDVNECQEMPTICSSTLQTCVNTNGSYRCDCLQGYVKTAEGICQDLNECLQGSNPCGSLEECINTPGSYFCSCKTGYTNNTVCTDINECSTGLALCDQLCVNTLGSYYCDCMYGFRLNTDRTKCVQVLDVCKAEENLRCDHGCTLNSNGRAACFCRTGYMLDSDLQTCIDINECQIGTAKCSNNCTNLPGSFACSCPIGYFMQTDLKTCSGCEAGRYGVNCASDCSCGVGAERCDAVTGCVCKVGWMGVKCDQDLNECGTSAVASECQSKQADCFNFPGGYRCQCQTGYQPDTSSVCRDVDECVNKPCNQLCENTIGSYRCLCNTGFNADTTTGQCQDNDECSLSVDNRCTQQCINTIGSYRCGCNQLGFVLANDGRTCTARVTCLQNNTCDNTNGGCSVVNGSDTCFCNSGYQLQTSTNKCALPDVNWCALARCDQTCENTTQSPYYRCGCRDGFQLNNDNKSCRQCPAWTYGPKCNSNCTCNVPNTVNCSNSDGTCLCKTGWNGTWCDLDIDECRQTGSSLCPSNSHCVNTPGQYLCTCSIGYFPTSARNCSKCTNNMYGENCNFKCNCNSLNTASCDHVNGTCYCVPGWTGTSCDVDVDECFLSLHNCTGQHEVCRNKDGGFDCVCDPKYEYNTSKVCDEVDWCSRAKCGQTCKNTTQAPYYQCGCQDGYQLNSDKKTCASCSAWTYGAACTNNCSCIVSNSVNCHNINGSCQCKAGWTGTTCEQDIDECNQTGSRPCPANSRCVNTPGSYTCPCDAGFASTTDGNCSAESTTPSTTIRGTTEHNVTVPESTTPTTTLTSNTTAVESITPTTTVTESTTSNTTLKLNTTADESITLNTTIAKPTTPTTTATPNTTVVESGIFNTSVTLSTSPISSTPASTPTPNTVDTRTTLSIAPQSTTMTTSNSQSTTMTTSTSQPTTALNNSSLTTNAPGIENTTVPVAPRFPFGLTINVRVSESTLNNKTSAEYRQLETEVKDALLRQLQKYVSALVDVIIHNMSYGSVIINGELILNTSIQTAAPYLAYALVELLTVNLTINRNLSGYITGITINNNAVTDSCSALVFLSPCDGVCEMSNGAPYCKQISSGKSYFELIIGLSVGIPFILIVVAVIATIVYLRSKRKRMADMENEERHSTASSIFAKYLATRNPFWSAAKGFYSPDAASSSSSENSQYWRREHAEYEQSPWQESAGSGKPRGEARPHNFSWDFLFKHFDSDQPFVIKRPNISLSPSQAYQEGGHLGISES